MKKISRFIVFILIIVGAMAFFKPSEKDFESWLKTNSAAKRGNAKGDNVIEKLVDKGLTTATQLQVLATYSYSNYHVLAVVNANANGEKQKYVGIVGTWIKIPVFD